MDSLSPRDEKSDERHTPGPWLQSHRETGPDVYNTQVYTADGEVIATLHWYPREHADGISTYREANARLIAGAPELLDALTDILEALRIHAPGTALNNRQFTDLGIKAYAALAKARG